MSDERFYEGTIYNDGYYFEREQELIRGSNLEIDYEESEHIYDLEITRNTLPLPQPQGSQRRERSIDYSLEIF